MNFKQYALFMCITRAKQKGEQLPISLPSQLVDVVDNFIANIQKNTLKHPKHRTMQGNISLEPDFQQFRNQRIFSRFTKK